MNSLSGATQFVYAILMQVNANAIPQYEVYIDGMKITETVSN